MGSLPAFSSSVTCLLHQTRRASKLSSLPCLPGPLAFSSLPLLAPVSVSLSCCQTSSLQLYLPHLHAVISICFACPSLNKSKKAGHMLLGRSGAPKQALLASQVQGRTLTLPRGRRMPHPPLGRRVRAWRVHGGQDRVSEVHCFGISGSYYRFLSSLPLPIVLRPTRTQVQRANPEGFGL